jgi:peroxiredoxin Q/BCP
MTQLQINHPLPDFTLPVVVPNANGATGSTLSRAELAGTPFVLFIYPKDATSGCTIEACGFRDLHPQFEELDVKVLGLSRDTLRSHVRFIEAQRLPYPLLSDAQQIVIRGWGLLQNATMYGKPVTKVKRTTLLVDGQGVVRRLFTDVQPIGHAEEVLQTAGTMEL